MRKNKKIIKAAFLCCFMALFSCVKDFEDEKSTTQNTNSNIKTYFISGNQARTVASKLSQQYGKTLSNQNTTFRTDSGIIVDYESIMVVENNINDIAYSLKVDSNQESETTFQNLALIEKDGQTQTKLITYEMTSEFADLYHADLKDISQFEGNITILDLSSNNCCGQSSTTFPITGGGGSGSGSYDDGIGSGGSYGDNGGASGGWGISIGGGGSGSGSSGGGGQSQLCQSGQHVRGDTRCIYTPKESGPSNPILSNRMADPNQNITTSGPRELCCIFDIGLYEDAMFERDCEKLKNLSNTAEQDINHKINWLKDKVRANTSIEYGSEFKKTRVYDPVTNENNFSYENTEITGYINNVPINYGYDYVGAAHCHNASGYQIFSFGDLHLFLGMYEDARPMSQSEVTFMLIANNPQDPANPIVYAITMLNYDTFKQAHDAIWNHPDYAIVPTGNPEKDNADKIKLIHEVQRKKFEANKTNLDKYFLQNYGTGFGLSLFKADDDLSNWNKLELGSDSAGSLIVQPKPCN